MFFGKFGFIILLSPTIVWSVEVSLSSKRVYSGDSVVVTIRTTDEKDIQVRETFFESNGVKAYYQGTSSETKIMNFTIVRTRAVQFNITEHRTGVWKIPNIQVFLDEKPFRIPLLEFEVIKRTPNKQEDDLALSSVKFHTNKTVIYVNETIIGYFALYYEGMRQPFLERDPNQGIEFPFFQTELVPNVSVQIPIALPYEKEIYALTPIKPGNFKIGKTKFIVGDSLFFGRFHETLDTEPLNVEVLPLPSFSSNDFFGAVGEYTLNAKVLNPNPEEGERIYLEVIVKGLGGGEGIRFQEPYQEVSRERTRKWSRTNGEEFGFVTESRIVLSHPGFAVGKASLPGLKLVYFSPRQSIFEEAKVGPFAIFSKPRAPIPQSEERGNPKASYPWIRTGLGLLAGAGALWVIYRKQKLRSATLWIEREVGHRRGVLLEQRLFELGLSRETSRALGNLKEALPDESISNLLGKFGSQIQNEIRRLHAKNI